MTKTSRDDQPHSQAARETAWSCQSLGYDYRDGQAGRDAGVLALEEGDRSGIASFTVGDEAVSRQCDSRKGWPA